MHMDPIIPTLVGSIAAVLAIGLFLRRLRQPHVVGYLLVGILLGEHGLNLLEDQETLARLGDIGVLLLLFFIGMEIHLKDLLARWKSILVGTAVQVGASVAAAMALGEWLGWPLSRGIVVGFVISLSSTTVVISLLRDRNESQSPVGQETIGILIAQDIAVIPMLLTLGFLGGDAPNTGALAVSALSGLAMIGAIAWLAKNQPIRLPFQKMLGDDHEMQVFAAFGLCFGLGFVSALTGLSAAIGAFLGGIILASAKETEWVRESLEPFRVVLVALFFVSIGMMIDLGFIREHYKLLAGLLVLVLLTNTIINAGILRVGKFSWSESLYGGALLAQIGEFSFVLAAVAATAGLIVDFGYQITIATIALSLAFSPVWIWLVERAVGRPRLRRG